MKVTLPTSVLLDAVGHAASVAASKSPKPVLECVALRADSITGLSLEATDLDVGLRLHLPDVEVLEEGELVIPAARLLSVARECDDEETTLVGDDGNLTVDTGRSHFRIRGEDPEGFPVIPSFQDDGVIRLPGDTLRTMIRRTVFATAKEAGRYALHGVLFRVSGDRLELVATDGRRLARAARTLDARRREGLEGHRGAQGALAPRPRHGRPARARWPSRWRTGRCSSRSVGRSVVSRLIDGTFPAYEDVIPKAIHRELCLARGRLRRRASPGFHSHDP